MFLSEKEIVFPLKKKVSAFFTKPVPHHISDDSTNRNQDPQNNKIQDITAGSARNEFVNQFVTVNACHKQEAVARKKKTKHEPGFSKNNKKHNPEAAIIDIKFRVQQVPECDCQKSFHINTLSRILYRSILPSQIKI